MSNAPLKTLDQITPEEFERINALARKRAATDDPLSLSIGLLVGNAAMFAAAFFILRAMPIVWTPMLVVFAFLAVSVGVFLVWRGVYRKFETPKEEARKQLAALQDELRARDGAASGAG